jgi:hypothetical protein
MEARESESAEGARAYGVRSGEAARTAAPELARIAERIMTRAPAATPAHFVERINWPILALVCGGLYWAGWMGGVVVGVALALFAMLNLLVVLRPALWEKAGPGRRARKRKPGMREPARKPDPRTRGDGRSKVGCTKREPRQHGLRGTRSTRRKSSSLPGGSE